MYLCRKKKTDMITVAQLINKANICRWCSEFRDNQFVFFFHFSILWLMRQANGWSKDFLEMVLWAGYIYI